MPLLSGKPAAVKPPHWFLFDIAVGSRGGVRAIGPSLGSAGVAGALQEPTLELFDAKGATVRAGGQLERRAARRIGGNADRAEVEVYNVP